jgi:hypothetical protein
MKKTLFNLAKAAFLVLVSCNSTFVIAEDKFLFEVLENTHFLNSWNTLINSRDDVEPWLKNYAKTRNGPTTPATFVKSGDRDYQINFVCKTHECGDNQFYVMFSSDRKEAYPDP